MDTPNRVIYLVTLTYQDVNTSTEYRDETYTESAAFSTLAKANQYKETIKLSRANGILGAIIDINIDKLIVDSESKKAIEGKKVKTIEDTSTGDEESFDF